MIERLAQWLRFGERGAQHPPKHRLSKDQAILIAQRGASAYPNCDDIRLVTREPTDDSRLWVLCSATVGRNLQVSVDDSTGDVVEIRELGIR